MSVHDPKVKAVLVAVLALAIVVILGVGVILGRFIVPSAAQQGADAKPAATPTQPDQPGTKLQATCPITGQPIDRRYFVAGQGQRIYVAGREQLAAVRQDPEAALGKLAALGQYAESLQAVCPVSGAPINRAFYVEYKGRRIYTCCPACRDNRVKMEPAKYAALVAAEVARTFAPAATP